MQCIEFDVQCLQGIPHSKESYSFPLKHSVTIHLNNLAPKNAKETKNKLEIHGTREKKEVLVFHYNEQDKRKSYSIKV